MTGTLSELKANIKSLRAYKQSVDALITEIDKATTRSLDEVQNAMNEIKQRIIADLDELYDVAQSVGFHDDILIADVCSAPFRIGFNSKVYDISQERCGGGAT